MVAAWRAQLDTHRTERRQSARVVLEYGSTVMADAPQHIGTPRNRSKATIFLCVLRDTQASATDGPLVHRGKDSHFPVSVGATVPSLVQEVCFDYQPESGDEVDSVLTLTEPNIRQGPVQAYNRYAGFDRIGYAISRPMPKGASVHITIHWSSEVGVAPLEIRHRLGRVDPGVKFSRRVVVQLPEDIPVLKQTKFTFPYAPSAISCHRHAMRLQPCRLMARVPWPWLHP